MLEHANGRWRTDCDRCKTPIEVVGAPDKRGVVELEKAGRFLESLGWTRLHRKGRGYRVEWWCAGCVAAVARSTKNAACTSAVALPPDELKKRGA